MNSDKVAIGYEQLSQILGKQQKHASASDLELARLYTAAYGKLLPIQTHQLLSYAVVAWPVPVDVGVDFKKKQVIYYVNSSPVIGFDQIQSWVSWLLGPDWGCSCRQKTKKKTESRSRPRSRPGKKPRSRSGRGSGSRR